MATQCLHGRQIAGHRIVGAQLPTVFGESVRVLRALLQRHRPALVLCTGQAGGRNGFSIERVAINVDDARIADNAGAQPVDTPVIAGAPDAYFTTLPIKAMLLSLLEAGIDAQVSQTAGTFVCNHVFYGLMHLIATERPDLRGGFVHLPCLPEQVTATGGPSMGLDTLARAVEVVVRTTIGV